MEKERYELIKRTVARGATDDEFQLFMHLAEKYSLDPFAKEIWFIKYGSQSPSIFTSRDGYLKIAHNHPDFEGIRSGVVCENDEYEESQTGVTHRHGRPRGGIIGAYAIVHRRKWHTPVVVYVPFGEYNQGANPTWKKYPSAMIMKVAEAMALKRAFSISGLVTVDEVEIPMSVQATASAVPEEQLTFIARQMESECFTDKERQYVLQLDSVEKAEKCLDWVTRQLAERSAE